MNKMTLLFDEFIMKAITMTEAILIEDYRESVKLENFTANRERLLSVIDQISREVNWVEISENEKQEFSRKIDYIKSLDMKLVTKLQEYQEEIRKDIEQTYKQKENIKGYNLSDVK